jgi:hypothetical protein
MNTVEVRFTKWLNNPNDPFFESETKRMAEDGITVKKISTMKARVKKYALARMMSYDPFFNLGKEEKK